MDHAAAAVAEFLNLAKDLPAGTFIAIPAQITNSVVDGYKLAHRNRRHAASLVKHTCHLMVPLVRAAASHSEGELGDALTEELDSLPKLLTEVQEGMLKITGRSTTASFLKRISDQRLIEDLNAKLTQTMQKFEMKGLLNMQIQQNMNERARPQDHGRSQAVSDKNWAEMHARLDRLQVTQPVITRARPCPLLQTISPYFTGRGGLVAQAVDAIADSSRPHISFFGTGGVGKTSLALAVAHHERCVQCFCNYRYFVECEVLTSASAVRSAILQVLAGSSNVPSQGDPRQVLASTLSIDHPVLVILDNFETPWNMPGQRSELTELLKELSAMPNVCMITTLRSDDAPASADVTWTRIPVQVLALDDARDLFLAINPSTSRTDHDDLDRLLKVVDCLPLAVKLLAEVKKHQTCSELLQRWQDTKTSLVKTERQGGTRLTSLDVSISLSLLSPLLDDVARSLLATICQLPAGVIGGRAKLKAMDLGIREFDEKLDALLEIALLTDDRPTGRLMMPPPIRAYVSAQALPSYEEQLEMHYIVQIERWGELSMGDAGYVERQDGLLAEHRMIHHPSLRQGQAVFAFTYLDSHAQFSTRLIACLSNQLTRMGWEEHRPHCMMRLGIVYARLGKYAEAERELQAARAQFVEIGDRLGAAQCLQKEGQVHVMLNKYTEAKDALQAAQTQFVEIGDKLGAAGCLQGLGNLYRMLNKCADAEDALQAARVQFVEIGERFGAAQCLLRLGDIHRMLNKYAEAENALQAAQAQFIEVGSRHGATRCLQGLGDVHLMRNKYAEAENALQAARVQFVELGDRLGAAQCLQGLGDVHLMLNKYAEAENTLQAARAQFVEIGSRLCAARCLNRLAEVHRLLSKYAEAEEASEAARAQFVEIKNSLGATQCVSSLGYIRIMLNKHAEAEDALQSARAQFLEMGSKHGAALCLQGLGEVHIMLSRYPEAEHALQASRAEFVDFENRISTAQCLRSLGEVYRLLNKYAEAENALQSARWHFVEIGNRLGPAQCLQSLGDVHIKLNKYAEAEDALQAARAQFIEIRDKPGAARCLRSLGDIHRMLSKYTEAADELQSALAQFVEIGDRHGAAHCLKSLGDLHLMLAKYTEAEDELQSARAQFIEIGTRHGAAECLRSLGNLYRMLDRHAEAKDALREAQAQFVEIGDRLGAAWCTWILAEVFCCQQRWQEAETLLAEAESVASSFGDRNGHAWICRYRGRLYKAQGRYEEA